MHRVTRTKRGGTVNTTEGAPGNQTVGIRFNAVSIPQGATVLNAWLQFQADETSSEATTLMIQGQAADNPGTFTSTAFGISSRPRTAASASWSPPAWEHRRRSGAEPAHLEPRPTDPGDRRSARLGEWQFPGADLDGDRQTGRRVGASLLHDRTVASADVARPLLSRTASDRSAQVHTRS